MNIDLDYITTQLLESVCFKLMEQDVIDTVLIFSKDYLIKSEKKGFYTATKSIRIFEDAEISELEINLKMYKFELDEVFNVRKAQEYFYEMFKSIILFIKDSESLERNVISLDFDLNFV